MISLKQLLSKSVLTEGVYDPGIFKCIFLAGGPSSGKSSVAADLFGMPNAGSFSGTGLKIVNSDTEFERQLEKNGIVPGQLDAIKKDNPDLWNKIAGDDNPNSIRAGAKKTTKKLQDFYEAGGLGIIFDGTGKDLAKITKQKKRAEALGYDCYMVFVNTSLEIARERNRMRGARGGRTVPEDILMPAWHECQNNIGAFQSLFSGKIRIVDNTSEAPAGKPNPNVDKKMVSAMYSFMEKPILNPIGKEWVKTAIDLRKGNLIKK